MVISSPPILVAVPAISFALAALMMPLVKRLATRFRIIAVPYSDSRHQPPTPLLGGAAITFAALSAIALMGALTPVMAAGAIGLFVIGLLDDVIVLRPLRKFLLQMVIVAMVVGLGRRFHLAPWAWLNAGLVSFFLLSTVNAFNLIDGLDGLAAGVGIVISAAATVIALIHGDTMSACQALAIGGALAGFLLYNLPPASIYMGDSGALPLGLMLGVIALRAGDLAGNSRLPRYVVPILLMLVPLMDTAIVSISRLATGTPVSRRGLDHSHHRLLSLGLSEGRAVALCWGVALLSSICAATLTVLPHAYLLATLPLIVVVFGVAALFMIDLTFDSGSPGAAFGYVQGLARFILSNAYKRRVAEAALDFALIPAAYFGAFLIRLDFTIGEGRMMAVLGSAPWVIAVTYAAFLTAGIYRGIWRYASVSDVIRFANGSILAGTLVVLISLVIPLQLSGSIAVLFVILLFNLLVASRMSFRALRRGVTLMAKPDDRVLIVGAGELAETAARYLASSRGRRFKLVGFVDDDSFKLGKLVHGSGVLGSLNDLERILDASGFTRILVAADALAPERMNVVSAFARRWNLSMQRFSIRLNDLGLPIEAVDSESAAAVVPGRPAAHGQLVV